MSRWAEKMQGEMDDVVLIRGESIGERVAREIEEDRQALLEDQHEWQSTTDRHPEIPDRPESVPGRIGVKR